MKGFYQRPFAEFPELQYDFQVVLNAANKGTRPTIPGIAPDGIGNLITDLWQDNPSVRPTATKVLKELQGLKHEYESNISKWDKLCTESRDSN
jgi:hypothetical protein